MPILLRERCLLPEVMDQVDMAGERHIQALRGLERINAWSGSARILWPSLAQLARSTGGALRVLDVATGAGDLPIRLWHRARRAGLAIELHGIDRSASAIDHARRRAVEEKVDVAFWLGDALGEPLPNGYDAVMCSLFLHHLAIDEAVGLLRQMAQVARRLVLVNDLERSLAGFLMAWVGTRVLSRSPVVHIDGPRSVRAAFTLAEVGGIAAQAGLQDICIVRRWPCRFVLTARGGR
jgi:SAM-dependent methyltransferase